MDKDKDFAALKKSRRTRTNNDFGTFVAAGCLALRSLRLRTRSLLHSASHSGVFIRLVSRLRHFVTATEFVLFSDETTS